MAKRKRLGKKYTLADKSKSEVKKYLHLYTQEGVGRCVEKRRTKLEKVETSFYVSLVDWLTNNLFAASSMEDFGKKKDEFREFRLLKYKVMLEEKEKQRKLVLNVAGKTKTLEVW